MQFLTSSNQETNQPRDQEALEGGINVIPM
jgi:hypothetical protein